MPNIVRTRSQKSTRTQVAGVQIDKNLARRSVSLSLGMKRKIARNFSRTEDGCKILRSFNLRVEVNGDVHSGPAVYTDFFVACSMFPGGVRSIATNLEFREFLLNCCAIRNFGEERLSKTSEVEVFCLLFNEAWEKESLGASISDWVRNVISIVRGNDTQAQARIFASVLRMCRHRADMLARKTSGTYFSFRDLILHRGQMDEKHVVEDQDV